MATTMGLQLKRQLVAAVIERAKAANTGKYRGAACPNDAWFGANHGEHWVNAAAMVLTGHTPSQMLMAGAAVDVLNVIFGLIFYILPGTIYLPGKPDIAFTFDDADAVGLPLDAYRYFLAMLCDSEANVIDRLLGSVARAEPGTEADVARLGELLKKLERLC